MSNPLVSFLTITRDRPELLRRCVDQFFLQTYKEKELIIVVDPRSRFDEWLPEFEVWLGTDVSDVHLEIGKATTVGGLRNETLKLATGKIVATWDDDDYNHPERITRQVLALEKGQKDGVKASYLAASGIYMADTKEYAIASFDVFGLAPSMVAWKDSVKPYPELERASDSDVQKNHFLSNQITTNPTECWLYARTYHGGNIWERSHFENFIATSAYRKAWLDPVKLELALKIQDLFGEDEAPKMVTVLGGERVDISP